ncbi:MAG: hypothetical protein K2Y05_08430 [Hyphomicrobiaceae bacterium]|nr:hypothetical protein [Hyphomicrobiaceae bacterium]
MGIIVTIAVLMASLYGHLLLAGLKQPVGYAALAVLAAAVLAVPAVLQLRQFDGERAPRARIASVAARNIAFVWIFGAMVLFLVYGFALKWREWLTFGAAMMIVGALSYGMAMMFAKDADRGKSDAAMLGFGRTLNIVQIAGMVIAMAGLLIDGKMAVAIAASRSDWAANSTFFAGAAAIVVIGLASWQADTRAAKRDAPGGASV